MTTPTVPQIIDAINEQATHGERNSMTLEPCGGCGSRRNYRLQSSCEVWIGHVQIARVRHGEAYMQCVDCGRCARVDEEAT